MRKIDQNFLSFCNNDNSINDVVRCMTALGYQEKKIYKSMWRLKKKNYIMLQMRALPNSTKI